MNGGGRCFGRSTVVHTELNDPAVGAENEQNSPPKLGTVSAMPRSRQMQQGRYPDATSLELNSELLNPRATALNQNDQHDHKQHAGYDPDHCATVHVKSPFL